MKDDVGVVSVSREKVDHPLGPRQHQLDFAATGLGSDRLHHWEGGGGAGPDHQPTAVPRNLFTG
jgi:hypothetical protein